MFEELAQHSKADAQCEKTMMSAIGTEAIFTLSELQTTKRLICSKTNAGNSLKADNPAKTKAELSKISRLQYIVKT